MAKTRSYPVLKPQEELEPTSGTAEAVPFQSSTREGFQELERTNATQK